MDWCRSVLFGKNKNEKKIMLFYTFLYMCVCARVPVHLFIFLKNLIGKVPIWKRHTRHRDTHEYWKIHCKKKCKVKKLEVLTSKL